MLAISIESFQRDGINGRVANQRFNILYIAEFRVLRAGAGPKQALGMRTLLG